MTQLIKSLAEEMAFSLLIVSFLSALSPKEATFSD